MVDLGGGDQPGRPPEMTSSGRPGRARRGRPEPGPARCPRPNRADIPSRSLLCLERSVDGQPGAWPLGKEFVALLQARPLPRMEGRAGAAFCIYWGEVSEDSDGPNRGCRPVPHDRAEVLAAEFPELSLRTEPAHREAFVHLGPGGQISPAQWQMASQSLHAWADEHSAQPSELGVRVTFLASAPATEVSPPDCDFAVPIS